MGEQKVAIVTGASSGIGARTAVELARRGYVIFLGARRVEKLQQVAKQCLAAGGQPRVVATDVTDRKQVEALVGRAVDEFAQVDVMVNNAGFGLHGRVHETTEEQMRRIFDVNFFGVFYGCQIVAPIMIAQRSGHIFNVSSVIGKRGSPFNGAYCATKFAVCGMSDSMRIEMKPYGICVTTVCPALTDTEFFDSVEDGTKRKKTSFQWLRGMQDPSIVARKIVATIGKNKPELIFTAGGRFLVILAALFPRLTDAMMRIYHDDIRGPAESSSRENTVSGHRSKTEE